MSAGGSFLDTRDAGDWLDDLEQSGKAKFLFESGKTEVKADDASQFGGMSRAEFVKLSPERKLAIANDMEAQKQKHQKFTI